MNSNVDVVFSKTQSFLSTYGSIIACGPKKGNLFTYMALSVLKDSSHPKIQKEMASYADEPAEIILRHHRLTHTIYLTLNQMQKLNTTIGLTQTVHNGPIPQCVNCLHGKQTRAPFQKTENFPDSIGDIVVSDLCGPFKTFIGSFRYFVNWISLKSQCANIEFLKNKECDIISKSFKHYLAWLL